MRYALHTIVAAGLGLGFASMALADAAQDFAAGEQAFRRGDVVGAMAPLRRAADAGHAPAQSMLAFIVDNAGMSDEAAGLYRRAAAAGHADAQAGLASMLLEGRGVMRDPREAFALYGRAAAQGHTIAIRAMADAYLRGDAAMLGDSAKDNSALPALRRAAENDYLPAIDRLATAYERGEWGAAVDAAEAARWRAHAAQLRPPPAGKKGAKK